MTISVFTLGCKTNYYESQQLLELLKKAGHKVLDGLHCADVVIINTCAITKEAEHKSRQAVARARAKNENCKVLLIGCASEKCKEQFVGLKNVTFIQGVANKQAIINQINEFGENIFELPKEFETGSFATQSRTRAFVKIQEGCNNFCSYCIVPYLRGRNRSRSIENTIDEIRNCTAQEIVLIGIDLSQYGVDKGFSLQTLFNELSFCKARIRLGSLEPRVVTNELLQSLKNLNFCPHFHLSLQSGCDETLKRMNRKYTTDEYFSAIQRIRKVYPNVAITTDLIVGFCGETDEEFEKTVEFVKKCEFSDVHVFPYSPREGTISFSWKDISFEIKKKRVEILKKVKENLKQDYIEKQFGKTASVLFEQKKGEYFVGYTPEYVKVYCDKNVVCGEVANVRLTEKYLDGVKGEKEDE